MTNHFLETNEKPSSHSETHLTATKGNGRKEKCCNKKKVHVKHINFHALAPPFRHLPLHPVQIIPAFHSDE
jgi:hypothetical protein